MLRPTLLLIMLTLISLNAAADTMHKVRFTQTAKVLVWLNGTMAGQGAKVAITPSSEPTAPVFGSGELAPTVSEPGVHGQSMTLSVASNTSFVIEARDPYVAEQISVRVIDQGANAQLLETTDSPNRSLIFEHSDKTAMRSGAPKSQAITLELSWAGGAPGDLVVRALAS